MFKVEQESSRMLDVLCGVSGISIAYVYVQERTVLTRARSYWLLRSCGEGSTSTMPSSLDSSRLRFIDARSG